MSDVLLTNGVWFRSSDPSPDHFQFKPFHLLVSTLLRTAFGPSDAQDAAPKKKWQGLPRFQIASEKTDKYDGHEYAKLSTILDTPMLELVYYSDIAGKQLP
jgi:hypothetical protein